MSSPPSYRVAVVQAAPVFMDRSATIDKCIQMMAEASAKGARLIAFPENFIPGYPWFFWLGSPAWAMQYMVKYHEQALVIDSADYRRLEQAAAEFKIFVSAGFTEKSNGSLYMAQTLIDDQGQTLATRRKLKPTVAERMVFGEGDGSDLQVHDSDLGRVGALCCWEHIQPLTKFAMYSQHEQLHVAAWPGFSLYNQVTQAISGDVNNAVTRTYAVEGQCFVLAPCGMVSDDVIDLLCQTDESRSLLKAGGGYARIYGPDGSQLATPLATDEEGILYADIDLDAVTLAKVAADPVGHYSRSDVTRLLFNSEARRPVADAALDDADALALVEELQSR
ncbi:carbon-nitrogen hydrolase family protein [Pseudomonas sp. FP2335]|uniref:carbon-nitrogen hydrolase family protein n=1 Tax=Pseudomonas sp. FP2335 TaxID=2954092 RepID=UPI002737630C|nr:carbon-nitrogen hydrolase family protein [Pseudomonas sp. FP2335]WLH81756.1 carbon-nitrogen hydrolase family protein [Pseudomonas sp. FP2335]